MEDRAERTEQNNTRLGEAPDAVSVRNADKAQVQSALDQNQDIWRSEDGHFAIVDQNKAIAKQKGFETRIENSDKINAECQLTG